MIQWRLAFPSVVVGLVCAGPILAVDEDGSAAHGGRMITIRGTIDTGLKNRVTNASREAVRDGAAVIIYDLQATTSDFGPCLDLANFLSDLSGPLTVAYVSQPLTGHAVLVALACDEIVMAPDAKIGDVYHEREPVRFSSEQDAYVRIAREKGHGTWIPLGMVDKNLQLFEVVTAASGKRFLPLSQLEEIEKRGERIIKKEVIKEIGQRLLLNASEAKRLGLIKRTADSRRKVASMYGLAESVASEDQLLDEARKPILLRLEGMIDHRMYGYVQRRLKQAELRGNDLLLVEINSTHGEESAATSIANLLALWPAKTVAWVPKQATGAAMLVLFGCDELVVGADAKIGGFQPDGEAGNDAKLLADTAVSLAEGSKYPEALVRRFVDKNTAVYEVRNTQNRLLRSFKTEAELADPETKAQWEKSKPGPLRPAGIVLELDGREMVSLDFAVAQAATMDELKSLYDVGVTVPVLQPGWVDALVDALTSTGGTVFLLTVAFTFAYLELQMPGFGVPGLLSALSFVFFFWSRFLAGTAISLEVVMFILGILFVLLEIFVFPGFGVPGFLGGVLILGSLVLASQSFTIPQTPTEMHELLMNVLKLASSFVLFIVAAATLARYLPHVPILNRMMLTPPGASGADDLFDDPLAAALPVGDHDLIGKTGVASSPLRPAGRMQYEGRFLDVVTQGEFIEPGQEVEIVEVFQNRIVVRGVRHV